MNQSRAETITGQSPVWAALGPLDQLRISGREAVAFIDNFTTAKVSALEPGSGCDGFFCDARGWVLDLALIRRTAVDDLLLQVGPGRAAELHRHLDRYHIREQLDLSDRSGQMEGFVLAGAAVDAWLRQWFDQDLPAARYRFVDGLLQVGAAGDPGAAVRLTAIDWYGPGSFLLETAAGSAVAASLSAAGLPRADAESLTRLRLLETWPAVEDIPEKTLPQELGLDDRAICFTKGCYLGQETVARLDALGHVNRRLTLLGVSGDEPVAPGAAVVSAGGTVAAVSSAAPAGSRGGWLALAIVPLKALQAETPLEVAGRPAAAHPPIPQSSPEG